MSSDPDLTRAVRSWLEEGANRLPDRVLDSVLAAVPTRRQRRSWWSVWRLTVMPTFARAGIAAALLVAGVAAGTAFLAGGGPGPGAVPTATPSATATAGVTPAAIPTASPVPGAHYLATGDVGTALEAGQYTIAEPLDKILIMTLPDGFVLKSLTAGEVSIQSSSGLLGLYLVDRVFTDPCAASQTVDTPTAAAVVSAFHSMTGFQRGLVSRTRVGERAAETFSLTNTIDEAAGCARGRLLPLFQVAGTTDEPGTNPGTSQFVWVIEGKNTSAGFGYRPWSGPIVIVADSWSTDADLEQLQAIVAAIQIH